MSASEAQAIIYEQSNALHNSVMVCTGLWIYEIGLQARYDWNLIRQYHASGRPAKAQFGKWTYLACRISILVYSICVIITAYDSNSTCEGVLMGWLGASALLGLVCATNLLSIRVAAVWAWNKWIVGITITISLSQLATGIYFTVKSTFIRKSPSGSCNPTAGHSNLPIALAGFAGDCILLGLLFTGLRRKWSGARQVKNGMWHLLWTQGMLYFSIVVLVEVPFVVLLIMDINPIMDTIMATPVVITLSVCATHMYRNLNGTQRVQGRLGNAGSGESRGVSKDNDIRLIAIRKEPPGSQALVGKKL
ncbi:unnamed protein product [Peniophora sp. CBMAI 1063]|nr:unnamed protein product [Peniophora sp. CBMAI 1063]